MVNILIRQKDSYKTFLIPWTRVFFLGGEGEKIIGKRRKKIKLKFTGIKKYLISENRGEGKYFP